MDEEHDPLGREVVAPLDMLVPHMQLDAGIDGRDHKGLGDDGLRLGWSGHEPSEQHTSCESRMAH